MTSTETSSCRCLLLGLVAIASLASAETQSYRFLSVDGAGRLRVVLDSGTEVMPALLRGQVAFGEPAISPDRRTVGWLALYPYPDPPGAKDSLSAPIAEDLVLYRNGRVIHRFHTEQVFWDWQFRAGGKQVAYSTGPTHGGAAECVLRDVQTGKLVARWWVKGGGEPPAWAHALRF